VISETEFVHLNPGQVIHDARETITCGYFINTGVVSILTAQRDGKGLEVGVIGNEGFTALPLLVEYHTSPTQLMSQGHGTAYRFDAVVLKTLVRQCSQLERQLHRYGQQLTMQTELIAACNILHDTRNDWRGLSGRKH
jgi:CRP-like cAMP-binding protein